jgi:DNA-binding MarR family transcriptional regulator
MFDHYMVLTSRHDGLAFTPTDLAQQYRRFRTSVTRIIDQLERLVLGQRLRGASERRKVRLRLTASGRTAIDTLMLEMIATLSLALPDISSEDIEILDRLLLTVLRTMGSGHGPTVRESGKPLRVRSFSSAS